MKITPSAFAKLFCALLILAAFYAQLDYSSLRASTARVAQEDYGLTNRACRNPFMLKLIRAGQQWYIVIRGHRYRLSQAGDALRPIIASRESKAVYLMTPNDVKYSVLQQFTAYARQGGVTCVNWMPERYRS